MAKIEELKRLITIDRLHDLADALGLERPQAKGNYRSPRHDDRTPSLSIFEKGNGPQWKDFSTSDGGDAIDLVAYVHGLEPAEAIAWVHDWLGIPQDKKGQQPQREKTLAEYIGEDCLKHKDMAIEWLVEVRGITRDVAERAAKRGTLGWNTYTNDKVAPGEFGHGGPAAAFIVRDPATRQIVGVDMRYADPALNGGVKTQSQGDKSEYMWCSDWGALRKAHTLYLTESSINALSVECCNMSGTAAVSIRGTALAESIPLHLLEGKFVVIAMDNDDPQEDGTCPGAKAAWVLYERLTAHNIACMMVDWSHWDDHNDINDLLKAVGPKDLTRILKQLEPWVIPGLPGNHADRKGKGRVWLPYADSTKYWTYRCTKDFTRHITKIDQDGGEGADGQPKVVEESDLAGFRVAAISRVTVSSATSTMTGDRDSQPRSLYSVSVQTALDGDKLNRKVLCDESIHNIDQWKRFGPVFSPSGFSRMLTILYRSAHLGARQAINLVGLGWRDGKLTVNEGPDCYFTDPDKQCPYHNLTFHRGTKHAARRVIEQYQATMGHNAAAQVLTWSLGGHLKVIIGYWPHMQIQADKGSGKSVLIKRLERTIGFTMFSGQSIQTEYRLITSISGTTHPVGWEELSQRAQIIINKAQAVLQESYQYTVTRRGTDMTEYLLCAPVLLAGEDVPVEQITGKIVRATLAKKGPLMPDDLPRFPVSEWLHYLADQRPDDIRRLAASCLDYCQKHSRAPKDDSGAERMVRNYAALLTAWRLLCEFAGIHHNQGEFTHDLIREMNKHIADTTSDREPWIWIVDLLLSEIARGRYHAPYKVGRNDENNLFIAFMPRDVMHHLSVEPGLRVQWDGLSVKSPRVFKGQLIKAGVVLSDAASHTINSKRQTHMIELSATELEKYGLIISEPDNSNISQH